MQLWFALGHELRVMNVLDDIPPYSSIYGEVAYVVAPSIERGFVGFNSSWSVSDLVCAYRAHAFLARGLGVIVAFLRPSVPHGLVHTAHFLSCSK